MVVKSPIPPNHITSEQRKKAARLLVKLAHGLLPATVKPETLPDTGGLHEIMAELLNNYQERGAEVIPATIKAVADDYPILLELLTEGEQETKDKRFAFSEEDKRLIKLHSIEDIYALPDPVYLISKIFETVGLSLIYGMSGTGKTFSTLNIALCIAHGIHWLGRRVKQGAVWYVNTEGDRNLKKRLKAWYKEHIDLAPTSYFKVIPWAVDLQENFQDLLNTIEATPDKPALIIFDNFSMCSNANQKNQEEVAPVLRKLNTLAQDKECQVLVLHHTNKENDVNGSMAFRNHVDTMIELKREDRADKSGAVLFCCQKSRDDEPFGDIKTELKQVALYTDPDTLETITSCVVISSESPIKTEGLKDTTQNILNILGDRSLLFNEWEKECIDTLKISAKTFDRHRAILIDKDYIEKYIPDGQKIYHYRQKSEQVKESLQGM